MLVATITGFSISLVLSVIYRQLIDRTPLVTWGVTALVLAAAVGLYASIDRWVRASITRPARDQLRPALHRRVLPRLSLLGAWSALYYAINFFLQVEEQTDRLERLEAQATSAQLAMLRYQLNPHFLFNTLNSISTLVLLKQTEPANAMLTRLSGFLRYTLVNQPGAGHRRAGDRDAEALSRHRADAVRGAAAHPIQHRSRRRRGRAPACCCSRWSRTRSNMPSARRKKGRESACRRSWSGNGCA